MRKGFVKEVLVKIKYDLWEKEEDYYVVIEYRGVYGGEKKILVEFIEFGYGYFFVGEVQIFYYRILCVVRKDGKVIWEMKKLQYNFKFRCEQVLFFFFKGIWIGVYYDVFIVDYGSVFYVEQKIYCIFEVKFNNQVINILDKYNFLFFVFFCRFEEFKEFVFEFGDEFWGYYFFGVFFLRFLRFILCCLFQ